jgi:hypothetical protein
VANSTKSARSGGHGTDNGKVLQFCKYDPVVIKTTMSLKKFLRVFVQGAIEEVLCK